MAANSISPALARTAASSEQISRAAKEGLLSEREFKSKHSPILMTNSKLLLSAW